MRYRILYPEDRLVTEEWIRSQFADRLADGDVCLEPGENPDLQTMMDLLDDAGIVTFGGRRG